MPQEQESAPPAEGAVKRYPFKFSPATMTLLILGLLLCAVSFGLTTWQFSTFIVGDLSSVYDWLKYILLYGVSIALFVLFTAMLIRSEYILTATHLKIRFGLIVSKYELTRIRNVEHFRGSDKLAVYFDRAKYMVIVVKREWYDDFVKELLKRNPNISFDYLTAEEEQNLRKK